MCVSVCVCVCVCVSMCVCVLFLCFLVRGVFEVGVSWLVFLRDVFWVGWVGLGQSGWGWAGFINSGECSCRLFPVLVCWGFPRRMFGETQL